MAFIFGEDAFMSSTSTPTPAPAPADSCGSTDSVSLESVDPNGEEWDMWETMKALRAQTTRRGRRAAKYRLAALKFKRSSVQARRKADELQSRYLTALERTEAVTRAFAMAMEELDEAKVKLASREQQPLPELGKNATCVICLDHPRGTAFVPCGHIACCQQCADIIDRHARRDGLVPRCPICKTPISKAQVLYYA